MKKDNRIVIEYTLDHEQITSPSNLTAAQKQGLQNTFQGHSRQLTSPCNIKDVHNKIFQARIEGILVNSGALDHSCTEARYRVHSRQLMSPWTLTASQNKVFQTHIEDIIVSS